MLHRLFWATLLMGVVGNKTLAQDPTKVEPNHYRLGFENERVQGVYIHYGPHEKSSLHEHPAGVVVNVTQGHLKFTDQNGKTQEVYAKAGEARWFPPFHHRVKNLSDTSYDGVYIAVKSRGGASEAMHDPGTNHDGERMIRDGIVVVGARH